MKIYDGHMEHLTVAAKYMSKTRPDLWPSHHDALRRLRSLLLEFERSDIYCIGTGGFTMIKQGDSDDTEYRLFQNVVDFYPLDDDSDVTDAGYVWTATLK